MQASLLTSFAAALGESCRKAGEKSAASQQSLQRSEISQSLGQDLEEGELSPATMGTAGEPSNTDAETIAGKTSGERVKHTKDTTNNL